MIDARARDHAQTLSNLRWLARLRWGTMAAEAVAVGVASHWLDIDLPVASLALVLMVSALFNALIVGCLRFEPSARPWMLAGLMTVDFVQLTVLLALSGGPSNPFSVLYLVNVALAAVVLAAPYAWALSGLSTVLFGSLFLRAGENAHGMHGHHMAMHYQGMWLAFAIAAAVIVYFVTRVSREAAEARLQAMRSEKLASLATLAAGAAHELATPLSTIAIVAKELERSLERGATGAVHDVRIIREEVARCREILSDMASDAGESAGEGFEEVALESVVEQALAPWSDRRAIGTHFAEGTSGLALSLPPRTVARVLRGLVKNALEAAGSVEVHARGEDEHVLLEVRDPGPGIPAAVLARVGEPFFTTKEPGRGMGLGVFLARVTVERLGGELSMVSAAGLGTTVTVRLRRNAAWPSAPREVKPSLS